MPCNSDYMEPTGREDELSKVRTLLDELEGKGFDKHHWDGYHPAVYSRSVPRELADKWVSDLCSALKKSGAERHSLEMQIWWRDHQAWDKQRKREEKEAQEKKAEIDVALAKLTRRERRLLGLK